MGLPSFHSGYPAFFGKKNGGEGVTLLRVHLLAYFTLKVLDYQRFIPVFLRKYMLF